MSGTVGRAFASDTRAPQFQSGDGPILFTVNFSENKTEPGSFVYNNKKNNSNNSRAFLASTKRGWEPPRIYLIAPKKFKFFRNEIKTDTVNLCLIGISRALSFYFRLFYIIVL